MISADLGRTIKKELAPALLLIKKGKVGKICLIQSHLDKFAWLVYSDAKQMAIYCHWRCLRISQARISVVNV